MAFVANDNQQLTLTDNTLNLTQREKLDFQKLLDYINNLDNCAPKNATV